MTKDDVLFGYRQQLFAEAARASVSAAYRTFRVTARPTTTGNGRFTSHTMIAAPTPAQKPSTPKSPTIQLVRTIISTFARK